MSIDMYPRVGAPLVPDVLSPVLGCERVSSRVLSELGLPLGMRLEQLDERVWVDLGLDAGLALGHDVLGCVRRRWSEVAQLQTVVSFGGGTAAELELSVRARNGLHRNDWVRDNTLPGAPLRDVTVCELALIPGFGAQSLLDVLSAASEARVSMSVRFRAVVVAARDLARAPWSGRVFRGDPRLGSLVRAVDDDAGTAREAAQRSIHRHCSPVEQRLLMLGIKVLSVEGSRLRRLRLEA
jgi:hypothetical protein